MVQTTGTPSARAAVTQAGPGQQVLRMHQVDPMFTDDGLQPAGKTRIEPLVPRQVPDERQVGRPGRELDGTELIELARIALRPLVESRPDDRQLVSPRPQAAGQLVRAPAAPPAEGGKDVGRNQ